MRSEKIVIKLSLELGKLNSLPAMPDIARKLLALPLETEAGEAQLICLIEQDPLLSAKIVGLANTPIMGVGRKINGIHDAAMLLGMKRLKSVSIAIASMSKLTAQPPTKNFDPHDLWMHSMAVALVMNTLSRSISQQRQLDESLIFLSGLLHDIGLMALHHLNSEASDELHHQLRLQPKRPMHEVELELLGITHAQIGALLVRHWNLPEEIVGVVEQHHSDCSVFTTQSNTLARLVNIAEKLLPDFGVAERTSKSIGENEWRELCIDSACAADLAALANELAIQIVQMPDTCDAVKNSQLQVSHTSTGTLRRVEKTHLSTIFEPIKELDRWVHSLLG